MEDEYWRIEKKFRDVDMVVEGKDGGEEEEFRRKIEEYGLKKRVNMKGGILRDGKDRRNEKGWMFMYEKK